MPYLREERRTELLKEELAKVFPETPGDLNYCFTYLSLNFLSKKEISYQAYNDCIGALEAAKLELYRRLTAPYEDKKIKENGDVY